MKPSARYQGLCAAPGAAPAATNSVFGGNAIETYEYSYSSSASNNNKNNNKPTNNINKSLLSNSKSNSNRIQNNPNPQFAYSSPPFPKQAAPTSTSSGSSFGTKTRGGSQAYTTEKNQQQYQQQQQQHSGRYHHKLEAYRPSPAEFQKSVQKHTILRTYIEENPSGQQQEAAVEQPGNEEANAAGTPKPSRGWSILSWRG